MESCMFCKIIKGDIPGVRVFEDAETVALMEINPLNDGHVLVVPKEHSADLCAASPKALQAATATAQRVAQAVKAVMKPDGLNLVQANGPGAAQSVTHTHIHVLPRRHGDCAKLNWNPIPGNPDRIKDLASLIRQEIIARA